MYCHPLQTGLCRWCFFINTGMRVKWFLYNINILHQLPNLHLSKPSLLRITYYFVATWFNKVHLFTWVWFYSNSDHIKSHYQTLIENFLNISIYLLLYNPTSDRGESFAATNLKWRPDKIILKQNIFLIVFYPQFSLTWINSY